MAGWIKLHRVIKEHAFFKEKRKFSRFEAWVDLLLSANHMDKQFLLGNEMVTCERACLITSEVKLMDRWGWSKSKVRAFLLLLDNEKMIVKKTDTKKTTITIVKYDFYQGSDTTEEPEKDRKRTAKELQKDTNKNVKNVENEKEYLNTFEHVWFLYPRKKGKGSVSDTQKKKIHKIGIDEMTRCVERYRKATTGTKEQFLQYGSTFFNSGYIDYLDENFNQKQETTETRLGVIESDSDLGPREEVWM